MDISFYVLMYIQDEYRRLYAYFLVLLFTVNVISYLLLRVVLLRLQVAEEFFCFFPPDGVHIYLRLFIVFY